MSHCLIKWIINVIKNNILIYNNLDNTTNSTGDNETIETIL